MAIENITGLVQIQNHDIIVTNCTGMLLKQIRREHFIALELSSTLTCQFGRADGGVADTPQSTVYYDISRVENPGPANPPYMPGGQFRREYAITLPILRDIRAHIESGVDKRMNQRVIATNLPRGFDTGRKHDYYEEFRDRNDIRNIDFLSAGDYNIRFTSPDGVNRHAPNVDIEHKWDGVSVGSGRLYWRFLAHDPDGNGDLVCELWDKIGCPH